MLESMVTVFREIAVNLKRTCRLAVYEMRAKNSQSHLGNLWEILNPLLNIFVYWFVFSVGLRTSPAPGASYPYVIWLLCGLLPWLTISSTMNQSAGSIISSSALIKTCNIPLTIYPVKSVMQGAINHAYTILIFFVVLIVSRIPLTWHVLEIVYYSLAMLLFLVGFALLFSTLCVLVNDLQKLLMATLRLLMYASGVVVNIDQFPERVSFFLRLNPVAYIIEGIRGCLLDGKGIVIHVESFVSFWVCTVILLIAGSLVHMHYREQFIDLL